MYQCVSLYVCVLTLQRTFTTNGTASLALVVVENNPCDCCCYIGDGNSGSSASVFRCFRIRSDAANAAVVMGNRCTVIVDVDVAAVGGGVDAVVSNRVACSSTSWT